MRPYRTRRAQRHTCRQSSQETDAATHSLLVRLVELYQLGEITTWRPARQSNSMNFVVTTSQGKYIFRRHLLSEETVAHEYEVLSYLERRRFPAPRMCVDRGGQAWVTIDDAILSVYEFIEGVCFTDFVWWPSQQRELVRQAGRTLARYHQAVSGLEPTHFKWDGYRPRAARPHVHKRWREGNLYRQSLDEIRSLLQAPHVSSTHAALAHTDEHRPPDDLCPPGTCPATDQASPAEASFVDSPSVDAFTRSHLDEIERLLDLESVIERRSDLPKVVIHGDYAPWNLLLRPDQTFFVLDFNAARLDLRIFDVILATLWFAWRHDGVDMDRAMAFQTGYCSAWERDDMTTRPRPTQSPTAHGERAEPIQEGTLLERPNQTEIALASDVFQWVMGRSIAERLRSHYLERRFLLSTPTGLERFFEMCTWAAAHPRQLTRGLTGHGLAGRGDQAHVVGSNWRSRSSSEDAR